MLQWPAGSWFSRPEADLAVRGRIQPAEGGSGRPRPDRAGRGRRGAGRRAGRGPAEGRRGEPPHTYRNRLWAQTLIFLKKTTVCSEKLIFCPLHPASTTENPDIPLGPYARAAPGHSAPPHRGGSTPSCPFGRATPPLTPMCYILRRPNQFIAALLGAGPCATGRSE